jgi:hypothetical protein
MPVSDLRSLMPNSYRSLSASEDIPMSNLTPAKHDDDVEHQYLLNESLERSYPDDQTSVKLNGPQVSNRPSTERANTFQTWWKELGLSLFTIGLLITIASILAALNRKPQPSWTLGLNLNTVVVLLATFLRSSLVMVVEAGKCNLRLYVLVLTVYTVLSQASGSPIAMLKSPCFINGIRYDEHNMSLAPPEMFAINASVPYQCVYSTPFEIFRSIASEDWYPTLVEGNCSMVTNQGDDQETRGWAMCRQFKSGVDAWWLSSLYNRGNATFETISTNMDNIATAITDSLRLNSIATNGLNANNTVNGTVWQLAVCTQFN